jgi:hypothetical protein
LEARGRVFPAVGPGVTALKRDPSGRYYVLAKPATVISIYDSNGNLTGRIPNANSQGSTITYAVDIDLSSEGLLFVADRGANAVEVFKPDGSLVARIPVATPTSIVALSGGQFAITSLTSKRLVQIRDEHGGLVRSFGDPTEVEDDAASKPLMDLGKIFGDSSDHICFAFTSVQDPSLRIYDRYGYVGYQASIPENTFAYASGRPQDRAEFVMNLSRFTLSDQVAGSLSVGTSGDVKFGGGMGTGLRGAMRPGAGFGRALTTGQGTVPPGAGGPYGSMGGDLGGSFSAQINDQGSQFQFGLGSLPGLRGGGRGRLGGDATSSLDSSQNGVLLFSNSANSTGFNFKQSDLNGALSYSTQDQGAPGDVGLGISTLGSDLTNGADAWAGPNGDQSFGLPSAFVLGSMYNSFGFLPQHPPGAFGTSMRAGGTGGGSPDSSRMSAGTPGAEPGSFGHFGHGRFGAGETGLTAGVRLNLGDLTSKSDEKPTITAVGMDPATHEIWAGIGDSLAHFNKSGDLLEIYYLTMKGGGSLKAKALLVEPDRILVAADPWGVFEFVRQDKGQTTPQMQINAAPAQPASSQ